MKLLLSVSSFRSVVSKTSRWFLPPLRKHCSACPWTGAGLRWKDGTAGDLSWEGLPGVGPRDREGGSQHQCITEQVPSGDRRGSCPLGPLRGCVQHASGWWHRKARMLGGFPPAVSQSVVGGCSKRPWAPSTSGLARPLLLGQIRSAARLKAMASRGAWVLEALIVSARLPCRHRVFSYFCVTCNSESFSPLLWNN